MKRSLFTVLLVLGMTGGVRIVGALDRGGPHLLVTPARRAIWTQMVADYTADPTCRGATNYGCKFARAVKAAADRAMDCATMDYGDRGMATALWWMMNGAPLTGPVRAYGDRARQQLLVMLPHWTDHYTTAQLNPCPGSGDMWVSTIPGSGFTGYTDVIRDEYQDVAVEYDWLYPLLTPADRTLFIQSVEAALPLQLAGVWGVNDDDQIFSAYNFAAVYPYLQGMATDNPTANKWINDTYPANPANNGKYGGYTATDHGTLDSSRKAMYYYAEIEAGGMWHRGGEYAAEAIHMYQGWESLRTAAGQDFYPEFAATLPGAAESVIAQATPDFQQHWPWGDFEYRGIKAFPPYEFAVIAFLAGVTQGTPIGPAIQDYILTFVDTFGDADYQNMMTIHGVRGLLTFNPYAPRGDFHTVLQHYSPGTGVMLRKSGWDNATDSFFGTKFRADGWATKPTVSMLTNHTSFYGHWGDFQLWRRGEWVVTHPIGYGILAHESIATNTMKIAGVSGVNDLRVRYVEQRPTYSYSAGTSGGKLDVNVGYEPNPPIQPFFVYENTRELLYLPSTDKLSDTIVIYDRISADDPRDLTYRGYANATAGINGTYDSWEAPHILQSPTSYYKEWIIHAPVAPTIAGTTVSWTTARGQHVRTQMLRPSNAVVIGPVDEHDAPNVDIELSLTPPPYPPFVQFSAAMGDPETAWQVRFRPLAKDRWDTFLAVVQAWHSTPTLTNTSVTGRSNAEGVLVERGSHNDVLVVFNGTPPIGNPPTPSASNHWRQTGFAMTWTAGTPTTETYATDLDPSRTWAYQLDGGVITPLPVSTNGLGRISLATASGARTIIVSTR